MNQNKKNDNINIMKFTTKTDNNIKIKISFNKQIKILFIQLNKWNKFKKILSKA